MTQFRGSNLLFDPTGPHKNYNYINNIVLTIETITHMFNYAQLTKPTRKTAKCRIKLQKG